MRITTIHRSLDEPAAQRNPAETQSPSDAPAPSADPGGLLFDRIAATLLLIPVLPVIATVWVLVKLTSHGPGFYSQQRSGLRGKTFRILKIRTMTWNCESSTGAVWAAPSDPRITALGHFLRATHLDELPQLFNVLRGEMALVGPRPERPEIIERLVPEIPGYLDRLSVRPGVTGLAQISWGADQTIDDVRTKQEYDLYYIRHRSLSLNLRIIFCTTLKMLHLNARWIRRFILPESRIIARRLATPHIEVRPRSRTHS